MNAFPTNADSVLFRCSALSHLMTEARGAGITEKQLETLAELQEKQKTKPLTANQQQYLADLIAKRDAPPSISDGVITHLIDVYLSERFGRKEDIKSKILDKGNEREEEAITTVSRVLKRFFTKNTERKSNEFIKGEWDLHIVKDGVFEETLDTKNAWSMHTFMRAKYKPLSDEYWWQGQGYMALTGAKKHTVCYCLSNGTLKIVQDELRQLAWRLNIMPGTEMEDHNYIQKARQIEINHIFDRELFQKENPFYDFVIPASEWCYDVPLSQRMHNFEFERDDEKIKALYAKIVLCRDWMNKNLVW